MSTAIWRFETQRFVIEFKSEEENLDPADSFQFEEDIAFARSGDPAAWFCAVVTVTHKPTGLELGRDVLGGCSYRSFEEFCASHRDKNPNNRNTLAMKAQHVVIGHYFPDMVHEAVSKARDALKSLCCAEHAEQI